MQGFFNGHFFGSIFVSIPTVSFISGFEAFDKGLHVLPIFYADIKMIFNQESLQKAVGANDEFDDLINWTETLKKRKAEKFKDGLNDF